MPCTKYIEIRATDGTDLNRIASLFTDHPDDIIEKLAGFGLVEGKSSFLASGDPALEAIKIEINYSDIDQAVMDEIDRILTLIQKTDDVVIEITTS